MDTTMPPVQPTTLRSTLPPLPLETMPTQAPLTTISMPATKKRFPVALLLVIILALAAGGVYFADQQGAISISAILSGKKNEPKPTATVATPEATLTPETPTEAALTGFVVVDGYPATTTEEKAKHTYALIGKDGKVIKKMTAQSADPKDTEYSKILDNPNIYEYGIQEDALYRVSANKVEVTATDTENIWIADYKTVFEDTKNEYEDFEYQGISSQKEILLVADKTLLIVGKNGSVKTVSNIPDSLVDFVAAKDGYYIFYAFTALTSFEGISSGYVIVSPDNKVTTYNIGRTGAPVGIMDDVTKMSFVSPDAKSIFYISGQKGKIAINRYNIADAKTEVISTFENAAIKYNKSDSWDVLLTGISANYLYLSYAEGMNSTPSYVFEVDTTAKKMTQMTEKISGTTTLYGMNRNNCVVEETEKLTCYWILARTIIADTFSKEGKFQSYTETPFVLDGASYAGATSLRKVW